MAGKSPKQAKAAPKNLAPGSSLLSLEEYKNDPERAFKDLLRIIDREGDGRVIPFTLRKAQKRAVDALQRLRAFNIYRSCVRGGNQLALKSFLGDIPSTAADAVPRLVDLGIDRILLKAAELKMDFVSDGPVSMIFGKPRQVGISTLIEAILFWRSLTTPNFQTTVMAHVGQSVQTVLRISKNFIRLWPKEAAQLLPSVDRNATNKIHFGNGAIFEILTAGSEDSSRGFKVDGLHLSEVAHYPDPDTVNAGLVASPKHCWKFLESTANGAAGLFYDRYKAAVTIDEAIEVFDRGEVLPVNLTIKVFSTWLEDPDYRLPLDPNEEAGIRATLTSAEVDLLAMGADLEQIKWRRSKIEDLGRGGDLDPESFFAQEYPIDEDQMFQRVGSLVFPTEELRAMKAAALASPPEFCFRFDGASDPVPVDRETVANLLIFEEPVAGEAYIIGGDVAQGLKHRDFSWASVFSIGDGTVFRQVAEWRGHVGARQFGSILATLHSMYNEAFIVPEWTGPGFATIDSLTLDHGVHKLYLRKSLDSMGAVEERYGFNTTQSSKKVLVEEAIDLLRTKTLFLRSVATIDQMIIFERNDKGQLGAPAGKHDDAVMACCLAMFGRLPSRGGPSPMSGKRKKEPVDPKSPLDAHEQHLLSALDRMVDRALKKNRLDLNPR